MTLQHIKAGLAVLACLLTVVGGSSGATLFYAKFERRIEALEEAKLNLERALREQEMVNEHQQRQLHHMANRYNKEIYIDE